MERHQIIALLLLNRRRKRKRVRRMWVHPLLEKREDLGAFYLLFDELRQYETKFFNYFRMSISSFDEMHAQLKDCLQRQNTKMRNCIQPVEMIAITLR